MTAETIHTCSYECDRPECIRAQRDELASRLAAAPPPAAAFSFAGHVYSRIEIPAGCSLTVDGNVLRVALSQQPEAQGVVDEAMVERAYQAWRKATVAREGNKPAIRAALTAALTEARNG